MQKTCERCGVSYMPKNRGAQGRRQRWCSFDCSLEERREAATLRHCLVDGCPRRPVAKDLCGTHYRRVRKGQPIGDNFVRGSGFKRGVDTCTVEGCEKLTFAARTGYCSMHHERWVDKGDIGPAAPLRRPPGTWSDWRINNWGYVVRRQHGSGKWEMQHRTVMEESLGRVLTPRENVHHINGRRADNRLENLELWVKPQPGGQRVEDLVEWVVEHYPALVEAALAGRPQLRLLG